MFGFAFLNLIISYIGWVIEYVGLFVVVVSVVVTLIKLPMKTYTMEDVRAQLATRIMFGLEFIIAADILLATVTENFDEILQLGAIVIIRIMLGYVLRKEVGLSKKIKIKK